MSTPGRGLISVADVLLLSLLLFGCAHCQSPDIDDSVAGPVVKHRGEAPVPSNGTETDAGLAPAPNANGTDLEKKKTIAQMLDEALEQEFPEEKQDAIGKNFNETAKLEDATVETVIKVSSNKKPEPEEEEEVEAEAEAAAPAAESPKQEKKQAYMWMTEIGNREKEESPPPPSKKTKAARAPGQAKTRQRERQRLDASVEKEVDRIIDSQDNEYVLSKPKDGAMGLTLDPQLIRDLTVLITSSTIGGMLLESLRQPVINGYFIAGSVVGPGGLKLIKELVQVESLAQVGVQLLLFALGLEFSLSKLRAVRSVALLGGMVEIFLFILVAGLTANFIGASVHEGIFVGALVSMSSTSIVVKCLEDTKTTNSQHGQITIGTLILQDCMVGLLFAFMPVLANNRPGDSFDQVDIMRLLMRVGMSLGTGILLAALLARTILPKVMALLSRYASPELYQLSIIAFCMLSGWLSGYMGLSTELGAFMAGVMLSATDQQESALQHLEGIKGFFLSLFICSTGLVMSPVFLAAHMPVLAGGVLLTVLAKTVLISLVVWMFKYPARTALAVGLSMAQIGEFAFVLLSVASQLGLLPYQVYMLLMGITALSLLITPFLLQACNRLLVEADPGNPVWRRRDVRKVGLGSSTPPSEPSSAGSSPDLHGKGLNREHRLHVPAAASMYPSETKLQQRFPFL